MEKIVEILLETNQKNYSLRKRDLKRFLDISSINLREGPLKNFRKHPNYGFEILRFYFVGGIRKIMGKKPAISEGFILRLVNKKINLKKIKILTLIYKNGKKFSFSIEKVHLLNLMGDVIGIMIKDQYNLFEKSIEDKIVLDCGAHHGTFSFLCVLMGAKKIYSFEPVSSTYSILEENILLNKLNQKIIPIKKAVDNKKGMQKIYFGKIADGSASLNKHFDNFEVIQTTSLDEFLKENKIIKVGLIKMDIEGNEKNALIGAKKIIKNQKPILTLSAYHKPEDKKELPETIKEIRSDYKIKYLNRFEEDFYCE
ncbi:MAG: FkbM family methyltransferase [Nanoarchaeota archaeon]|nr:FkbM family methyltransferase [Nanoarchaeota archaeon]